MITMAARVKVQDMGIAGLEKGCISGGAKDTI